MKRNGDVILFYPHLTTTFYSGIVGILLLQKGQYLPFPALRLAPIREKSSENPLFMPHQPREARRKGGQLGARFGDPMNGDVFLV